MALPSKEQLDAMIYGIGISLFTEFSGKKYIAYKDFFFMPVRGERYPWSSGYYMGHDGFDDGGGAAIAAYRYGLCPFS